jgi:hypothetical protein
MRPLSFRLLLFLVCDCFYFVFAWTEPGELSSLHSERETAAGKALEEDTNHVSYALQKKRLEPRNNKSNVDREGGCGP